MNPLPAHRAASDPDASGGRLNIEFKARLDRPTAPIEAALGALGAIFAGTLTQRDSYFHTATGRLKLREVNRSAELIAYQRDERQTPMVSRYQVTPVADAARSLAELSACHGLRGVVEKTRRLWLYQNARIHLDEVAGLGAFLEIEVVQPALPEEGAATLAELLTALSVDPSAALQLSYIDLLGAAGAARPTLPDLLAPGLDLVFVGINPSIYSAERGQYFARPANRFWPLLNGSGLLPAGVQLGPAGGPRLLEHGIGLTDSVTRATPSSADLTAADFAEGRVVLREKLLRFAPRAVCFVGKIAYQQFSGARVVAWGRQPEAIGATVAFVMPSTSGRANGLHAQRIASLAAVRAYLDA